MITKALITVMAVMSTVIASATELVCPGVKLGTGVRVEVDRHPYMVSLTSHQKRNCKYEKDHWLLCDIGTVSSDGMNGETVFAVHGSRDVYMGITFNNIFRGANTPEQRERRVMAIEQSAEHYGFTCSRNNPVLPHGDVVCITTKPLLKCKEK